MSQSNAKNVKLGVCSVTFDGVDLGYTKGGVEVSISTDTSQVTVDQFGKTPIDEVIVGRSCKAKVPLAESTLANFVRIMPGATLNQTGGAKASGTITFVTAAPIDGDKVTINGVDFAFKTTPAVGTNQMAIPASIQAAATALAAKINASTDPKISSITATVNAAVVTLTADDYGTAYNAITLVKSFTTAANCTVSAATLSGGVDPTVVGVSVPSGVGLSLIKTAKRLVLHPQGVDPADKSDDFVIPLANTPGAATFAYKIDEVRVFNLEFTGYPDTSSGTSGKLFYWGDESAGG